MGVTRVCLDLTPVFLLLEAMELRSIDLCIGSYYANAYNLRLHPLHCEGIAGEAVSEPTYAESSMAR